MTTHLKPRYDLILPHFPGRSKETLQSQVSRHKKKLAEAGGAGPVAPVEGRISTWFARPAVERGRARLSRGEREVVGKACRAVLRVVEAQAG